MDCRGLLAVLVLLHLLPLLSTQEYKPSPSNCPTSFKCAYLGPVHYPFSNSSRSDCGLCVIDCDAQPSPKINLGSVAQRVEVKSLLPGNFIQLYDPLLQSYLDNSSCDIFNYSLSSFNSPFISFTVVSSITLFKCINDSQNMPEVLEYFRDYNKSETCNDFALFYRHPNSYVSPDRTPPNGCEVVNLPMVSRGEVSKDTELFQLLTAEFELEWHLSEDCQQCYSRGDLCYPGYPGNCSPAEPLKRRQPRNTNLKVILSTAIPGCAFVLIVLAIFLIWRRKKRISGSSYFLSRNSSEPYSKPDLEGGSAYFGVPVFSYSELEKVTNNFDTSKELGDGGFGTVYYGKLQDGREVAVKRLYEHNFKRMEQFMNEIEILTRLRHRNLVTLYGCTSRRSRELLLVYEYIPNGTVDDHLHGHRAKDKSLTWPVRMNIAIETAGALAYLHASDIIHRDVKTNNILLDHNFSVKVADFGLSRLFPNDVSHISTAPQGTPGYVDPEYHQCYQLTDKSDVYSFGVVLIELISSMPAVDISRHRHEINLANLAVSRIQRCAFDELIDPSLGYHSDPEVMRMTTSVAELAFRCLQLEKEMRPNMDEVLETLKEIQNHKDNLAETEMQINENAVETISSKVINENAVETISSKAPISPESEDVILLKKSRNFPSSPNSVADAWVSGSSTTSTSR